MKFRIRFAEQLIGIFILVAIALLAVILILMGINQRWFAKNYYFHSQYDTAEGLSRGMPIKLKGFKIGKVSKISLNPDYTVNIQFYIEDTYYQKIRKHSVLELSTNALGLGGSSLILHPDRYPTDPLLEFGFIPFITDPEAKKWIQTGYVELPQRDDTISRLLEQAEPILTNTNETLISLNQLLSSLNGKAAGPVGDILSNTKTLTAKLNGFMGNLNAITADVKRTTASLTDSTGLVKKLIDPKGSLATLLDDDNILFDHVEEILMDMTNIMQELKVFAKYVNNTSPQITGLLEETRVAIDEGKDVLEGLKNNPLLRGGITKQAEQPTTFQSYRDEDF